jgi:hypothetical protein
MLEVFLMAAPGGGWFWFLLHSLVGLLALSVPAAIATAGLAWDYIFYFH